MKVEKYTTKSLNTLIVSKKLTALSDFKMNKLTKNLIEINFIERILKKNKYKKELVLVVDIFTTTIECKLISFDIIFLFAFVTLIDLN